VRTPYFVPEGAKADVTFRNMKKQGASFAVVLDEYAGFSGIITVKNLIECIVGDIGEEEPGEKEEEIQKIGDNQWRIDGNVSLSVLAKAMETEFPDEYETISGLVLSLYGTVPEDGSQFSVETEDFSIQVSDVREHQVTAAVITLTPKEEPDQN